MALVAKLKNKHISQKNMGFQLLEKHRRSGPMKPKVAGRPHRVSTLQMCMHCPLPSPTLAVGQYHIRLMLSTNVTDAKTRTWNTESAQ